MSGPAADAAGVGAQLRRYREQAGLSQEALAERAGLAAAAISALERGVRRRPFPHTIAALATALGLSAAERAAFAAAARPPAEGAATAHRVANGAAPGPTEGAAAGAPPSNLPAPPTPLIGREREAAALADLLGQDGVRLVTLTGIGGGGKTRLGLHVAAALRDRPDGPDRRGPFPAGVWLVELAPIADPALVPHAVAAALGVREAPGAALLDRLVAALRPPARLLVLDNCEHVLAACAALAARLLAACPALRILATSREPLQIAGERQRPVPPLAAPDPGRPPSVDDLARYPAVALFVARAQAVAPAFALTPENAAAVALVCARLDGIPLALELAAARAGVLSVAQIAARLDDCLRLLTGGSRAGPTRQQTLRGALDWSHDLLAAPEQAVFRRLAAFPGEFDLAAAEAVGSDPWPVASSPPGLPGAQQLRTTDHRPLTAPEDVLDVLTRLVDQSLVVAAVVAAPSGAEMARYRLLEPVRQYARARLEASGEAEAVRQRHAAHYLALAERAEPRLYGPALPVWRARLEQEHHNLRAALDWCLGHDPETGLALAGCLAPFWHMHGHDTEGRRRLDGLLAAAAALDATAQRPPPAGPAGARRGKALLGAGVLALRQRDFAAARTALAQSLAVYRQAADAAGTGWAEHSLGLALVEAGDYGPARQLVEASRARFEALDDQRGIATALASLAELARRQGDLERAGTVAAECLARFRALGDTWDLTRPLLNRALIAVAQADYGRATALYEETLALYRELGDEEGVREVLGWLGNLVRMQGDYRRARELLGESLALARKSGVQTRIGLSLHKLGHVAAAEAHPPEAWRLYEESLALYRADGDLQLAGVVLGDMGNLARVQGDYGRAGALWAESATLARSRPGHIWLIAWTLGSVGTLLVCRDDVARGVRLLSAAAAIHPQVRLSIDPDERADWDAALAQGRAALGPSTFAAAWAAGQAMPPEQALTDAEAAASGPPAHRVPPAAAALTAREREVAALIAAGCHTDRQIAARLTIAPGTAGVHVQRILEKLDLHSRWQVADWAMAHGLRDAPAT